jgi:PKHD-type hydroxylase
MQVDNHFWYYTAVLSPEICNQIIDLGDKSISEKKQKGEDVYGTTFGNNHKQANPDKEAHSNTTLEEQSNLLGKSAEEITESTYIRDSEITWLSDDWIYDLIKPYINDANRNAGWRYQYDTYENFQYTTYRPGGFYNWHSDGGSCHNSVFKKYIYGITENREDGTMPKEYTHNSHWVGKIRKLSMTINLNTAEEYEGGTLKFDFGPHANRDRYFECTEARKQGSIIIFPSFVHHQITPITSGIRKSLVLWTLGRPFK